ncbi:MAG: hypothetical protein H0V72_04190 [Bradyrhizobium sp.]|nr:hypothetical protein [Bradyrhizobium sp.]
MTVISFPRKRIRPNAIRVELDFGRWALAYFRGHQFASRLSFVSKAAAEAEARRLAERGMIWRMGGNGTVYVFPDGAEGGCWAVAHRSKSEGTDALLGRHIVLNDALDHAIRAAQEIGAEFSMNEETDDQGGAA